MNKFCVLVFSIILSGCANTATKPIGNSDGVWTEIETISGPTRLVEISSRLPEHLINRNLSVIVKMEFTIDMEGKPINIKTLTETDQDLVSEAIQTLSRNRYSQKYSGKTVVVEAEFHRRSGSK